VKLIINLKVKLRYIAYRCLFLERVSKTALVWNTIFRAYAVTLFVIWTSNITEWLVHCLRTLNLPCSDVHKGCNPPPLSCTTPDTVVRMLFNLTKYTSVWNTARCYCFSSLLTKLLHCSSRIIWVMQSSIVRVVDHSEGACVWGAQEIRNFRELEAKSSGRLGDNELNNLLTNSMNHSPLDKLVIP
jgi:hypothetical protein